MKRTAIKILASILGMALLIGCLNKDTQPKKKDADSYYYIVMLDGTGSYLYHEKAKRSTIQILKNTPGIKKIVIRWISEDSISDKNSIASGEFEEISVENPFNMLGKKLKKKLALNANIKKDGIIKEILNAPSPKAPRTDIYGALAAATARFEGVEPLKPVLILFTDMQDNTRKKYYKINLNGAKVKIMDFQVGNDIDKIKNYWSQYLIKHGASSVEFKYIDNVKGGA